MFEDLAARADRAMRTHSARATAIGVFELIRAYPGEAELLSALATRRGWTRRTERDFACSFGGRTATLTVPRPFDVEVLASLVTRAEVNACLGDTESALLTELQGMAQRELQRLFDDAE
jgi:hypothetical protein